VIRARGWFALLLGWLHLSHATSLTQAFVTSCIMRELKHTLLWLPQGSFQGTLFRFPLRSSSTAAASDIKASATSASQALGLLQSLAAVLPQALLFLKSLRQIEVYVVGDAELDAAAAAAVSSDSGGVVDVSKPSAEVSAAAAAGAGAGAGDKPRLLFRAVLSALDGESQHGMCCSRMQPAVCDGLSLSSVSV
jgi:hypothetical protein